MVRSKTYQTIPFCDKEIWRYAQSGSPSEQSVALLQQCKKEAEGKLHFRVCYRESAVKICDSVCDFGAFSVCSHDLAKHLAGCRKVVIFAATLGLEMDRLIAKYSRLSPAKALLMQAMGSERAEALCDTFCRDIAEQYGMSARARFSAGYGDVPLETQRDIFAFLECEKTVGITLHDSLLMTPSKSVTAFVGLD